MRGVAFAGIVTAICCSLVGTANAGVKIAVNKDYYSIAGRSGAALLDSMDRYGPKHGFLTRAIAQTRYSVGWDMTWVQDNGACRVTDADATLTITYIYPNIAGAHSPELRRRWARFMRGVTKHEETHGAIAREMAFAAERSVRGLAVPGDPDCRRARYEVKRRVGAIYAKYEQRQRLFDKKEHREGGRVEGLVAVLRGQN
jgi:predicted secreted Zn-dependent protease